ncbi:MAG: branched-chain amino acid ABC transporter permease [Candidatus Tectomicrobia bacterium]|nr:branched-chain amino acid ABC transporter permease [Candidatus Tectomicrobia bacterium]
MGAYLTQLAILGVLLGGLYALAAFGLSIIFGVSRVLNVAHGDLLLLGALLSYALFYGLGMHPFLIMLAIIPIFLLVGFAFERFLIRPISNRSPHELLIASILLTLGVSMAVSDLSAWLGGASAKGIAYSLPSISIGSLVFPSIRLLIMALILAMTLVLSYYLKSSYVGRAMRAITQDREGAMIVGVNIPRVSMITFGIGAATAAVAGSFYIILFPTNPYLGIPLTVKYLAIIVLGGLGSLSGALLGGIILGLAEQFSGFYFGGIWQQPVAFILLILILLIRPQGIFGRSIT